MDNKPRIFIGSSSDSIQIANSCNVALDHEAEVSVWPYVFDRAGSDTLTSLITKANNVDFALFVFSPDDIVTIHGNDRPTVRDNVLFELGLFIGSLSKERCFILRPRGVELYIASDLAGINTLDFEPLRRDKSMDSAVNSACTKIINQMKQLGASNSQSAVDRSLTAQVSKNEYTIEDKSLRLLAELLSTHTSDENGLSFWEIEQKGLPFSEAQLQIALIKLTRINYVERSVREDYNGNTGYRFSITNNGIEFLLENEIKLDRIMKAEKEAQEESQKQRIQQSPYGGFTPQSKKDEETPF